MATNYNTDPSITVPAEVVADGVRSWSFPVSWGSEEAAAFLGVVLEEQTEEARIAALEVDDTAPAVVIAARVKELAEVRALRIVMERDVAEDAIYQKAALDYGGERRVARVRTPEGSIILRPLTLTEVDRIDARASAPGMKPEDAAILYRQQIASSVVHPSRARYDAIVEMYPSLMARIIGARDALIDGRIGDAEKKA